MDTGDTCVTAKIQIQTSWAARYCVRKKVEEKDAEEVEWGTRSSQSLFVDAVPWGGAPYRGVHGKADSAPSAGIPGVNSPSSPAAISVPASPSLSLQVPPPPFLFSSQNRPRPLIETACSLRLLSSAGRFMRDLRGISLMSDVHKEATPERKRRTS